MDGAQSDLRTGLPWQMVEIHEPARLAIVIESTPERVRSALRVNPALAQLVANRWIFLSCLDPASSALFDMPGDGAARHTPRQPLPVVEGTSAAWYEGKRGFLPPVALRAEEERTTGARSA
jgi:hypothetical protein